MFASTFTSAPRQAIPTRSNRAASLLGAVAALALLALLPTPVVAQASGSPANAFVRVNLVSNLPELRPVILDPLLKDAWGIAIRPPGAGGHWWITNAGTGTTTTYVGDVPGEPIFQDSLLYVDIPTSYLNSLSPEFKGSEPTGVAYTGWSPTDFIISGEGITTNAKFVFNGLEGTISGWTNGQTRAVTMVDNSVAGAMYTGLTTTELPSNNRLFACDFGNHRVQVFNNRFQEITTLGNWQDPSVPDVFAAFNMQYLDGRVYVAWARTGDSSGEEDHYPGYGFVSAFDTEGRLLQSFEHRIELNAPWGLAIAPANFGPFSGALLVGNFADGQILAYSRTTGQFIDLLRDPAGEPVAIDGLWALQFGNGVRLGYTNHLYFAAGPNNEEDGVFGKLVHIDNYCVADVCSPGGAPGKDGIIEGNDFVAFINAFASGDLLADIASGSGAPIPDGVIDGGDFIAFINSFALGCN